MSSNIIGSGSGNTANNKPRRHYVGLCLQASMVGLLIAASVANRGLWESSSSSPVPTTNSLKLESTTTTVTTRLHHEANQGQTATSESATIFSAEEAKEHYQYHDSHSSPSKGQTTVSSDSDSSQSSLLSLKEAKEFLMQGARERTKKELVHQQEQEKQDNNNNNSDSNNNKNHKKRDFVLPPLESLISNNNNNRQPKILADVQFLLDFAVVGFGKCGTTTLLQWLQQTNSNSTQTVQVRAPSYEAQFLVNRRPTQLVRKLYQFAVEEQELQQTSSSSEARILKGFKNPSDIRRPHSRALLTQYWPETPLIVTVRHPVQWMVSIYNYFKIEKGRHKASVTAAQIVDRGGRDHEGNTNHYVSTAKGEFHAILAELGKTKLVETQEWNLLSPWLDPATTTRNDILEQRLPNPIFFMELQQLADTNVTRARQFRNDLEHFLGLPRDHLPPALHVRPNTQHIKQQQADKLQALKLDICASENAPILQEMMDISRAASQWLRHYFIVSPGVTVSSPDYIHELLKGWMISPCPNDENDNQEEQPFVRGYKPPLL